MNIKCKISPRLIMNVSSLYTDTNRVIMEFLDNSIDSWAQMIQSLAEIVITVSGRTNRTGKVIISDNCTGIRYLRLIVESIGNSEKKSQPWTNGQFGFGIFSFMAVCNKMEIRTKHKDNDYSEYIVIRKDDFMVENLNDLNFEIEIIDPHTPISGTEVTLSEFSRDSWSSIDLNTLKTETENHFELLLHEPNLTVRMVSGKTNLECTAYDYDSLAGTEYEKDIPIIIYDRKLKRDIYKDDIKVYMKITPGVSVERPPVIISKNRRVTELCNIKSFRTYRKRDLWNHPGITGYIDTKDMLNPTLARNDFRSDPLFRAVKKAILDAEDEIRAKVEEIMAAANVNSDFSELENRFNDNISDLLSLKSDEDKRIMQGDIVITSENGDKLIEVLVPDEDGQFKTEVIASGKSSKLSDKKGNAEFDKEKETVNADKIKEYIKTPRKDENNLRIKIDDKSEPIKDRDGNEKRSELFGNVVVIYRKHKDFEKRIYKSFLGKEKITSELINYIASEMLVHYTNYYFQKSKDVKATDQKQILIFFTNKLYMLEDSLKGLIDKPLSR